MCRDEAVMPLAVWNGGRNRDKAALICGYDAHQKANYYLLLGDGM